MNPSPLMRQLHILDPQLVDYRGHYFNYCAQAVREVRRRGVPVSIYARKTCQVACEGLRPEPIFSHDIFAEVGRDPEVWALENFHAVNQAFAADLSRIPVDRLSAEDLLFFPTLQQNQLYAIALWLGRIPAARRPAVAVLLRYLTPAMEYIKNRANRDLIAHLYRYAALSLVAAQPRTLFCTDTREMADAFHAMLGQPVLELPVAMEPLETPPEPSVAGNRPTVVYLGHVSPLKGFHLLPEIIAHCSRRSPRPRFIVQVQSRADAIFAPVCQWLDGQPPADVRVVEGALSPEHYHRLLAEADIVLLPYSPSYYGHCSSGVFAEAAALGKVVVVPANTVAARQGREFGLGVSTAETWTGAALAGALERALRDLGRLQAQARGAAAAFRADQSVQSFWTQLLAQVPAAVLVAA